MRVLAIAVISVSLIRTDAVRAEDWRQEVEALRPLDTRAQEKSVLDNLEERSRRALEAIPHARTREEADAARAELRRRLEHSLGLGRLPWPPKLDARSVGTLERPGYRIEKVVYETLPGALVPAHVYRPGGAEAPAPAVVFYPGHWWADSKARPDFQAFCITMARLGFVVLSFDPFGQGERGISSRDHRRTEALLVGVAQQGFAAYETRCALEYLRTRPDVDPERIGMTGASGGGYNTWITSALDDRIQVAVPVVGTSEFLEQIRVCLPLDWYRASEHCHFVPGLIRYANNHELLAMVAPRPLLIVGAAGDQSFPVPGTLEVSDYGRALYRSYGAPAKVGLMIDAAEGHGYQRRKREAAYGWFLRWLMHEGDGSPHPEPPVEPLPFDSAELRCFPPGRNQPAGPAMIALVERLARDLPPSPPRLNLDEVLGPSPEAPRSTDPVSIRSVKVQRLLIPSEPGLALPAFVLRPAGEVRGLVIAVDDRGKEALATDPLLGAAFDRGWAVCGVDVRGVGELATTRPGWAFAVSLLLGENIAGRQAWDLGRALTALRRAEGLAPAGPPIGLYARGPNASLAASYAIARAARPGPESAPLRWYVLREGYLSFRALFERPREMPRSYTLQDQDRDRTTAFDREIPAHLFAFGALRHFDLPQLLAASPAEGLILDPIDGDGSPLVDPPARRRLPPRARLTSAEPPEQAIQALLPMLRSCESP